MYVKCIKQIYHMPVHIAKHSTQISMDFIECIAYELFACQKFKKKYPVYSTDNNGLTENINII